MSAENLVGDDRRVDSRTKVQNLVQTRTETLALLTDLAGKQPFTADPLMEDMLKRFCQALIDYTASAHFQLYSYLADNRERRRSVLEIADQTYPKIVESTDVILRFNDKYDSASIENCTEYLASDLSRLGECLADRILLEDRIIRALHGDLH